MESVKKILNGGGGLSTELTKAAIELFPQAKLLSVYVLVLAATNAVATRRANAREGGAEDEIAIARPGCQDKCGNLRIPYPFGIGHGCYSRPQFSITCKESKDEPTTPRLMETRMIIANISLEEGELQIMQLVNRDCYDRQGRLTGKEEQSSGGLVVFSPYTVSGAKNMLVAVGCDTYARFVGSWSGQNYTTGCISVCQKDISGAIDKNDSCSGMGCCETKIPPLLNNLTLSVGSYNNHRDVYGFNPCGYAFVVKKDNFTFSKTSFQQLRHTTSLPVVLDWQIREESCYKSRQNNHTFACKGNTICLDRPTGYICRCKKGFQGNPYLHDCQDIDECSSNSNLCKNGKCKNELGSYTCSSDSGHKILLEEDSNKILCKCNEKQPHSGLDAGSLLIPLGASLSFFFVLLVGFFWKYHDTKKKSFIKLKNKYFEANGGKHFEDKLAIALHGSKKRTFTEEEVKEATKNFHESEKVGEGGYGIVYKGILDKQKVAIKKLKRSPPKEPFVQEMIVLSQINHKNVVRLVGCCFETPTPILVYEFIDHGTLYDRIHEKSPPLSLKLRLKIAAEAADALAYLHHSTSNSTPIIHGDVKTANILLDENFTAKVSDFGASRLVPEDENQISTLIQGTLGYLDPEYLQSNKRTEKSDVYSFGVVLVELLTSRKAVCSGKDNEKINLADVFISMMEKDGLNEILDRQIVEGHLKRVADLAADLAKRCLSVRGKERPSMNDVAVELQGLVRTMEKHPSGGGEADISLSPKDTGNLVGSSASSASLVEDPEGQAPCPAASNKIGELSRKNKWESKLLSASFLNKMIVISCVIAISLDPLFFYIPTIDEDNKCLGMDKKLRSVALILRSLTDITFLVHIGYQIWEALDKAYKGINKGKPEWQLDWQWTLIRRDEIIPFAVIFAGKLSWGSLLIDLLSVFPMPQLLFLKVFYKMKGKGYLERRKVVNFFLISQYLPRICRIILSSKKLTRTTEIWIKVLVNLFLYILASHVLGAFWYFFSIQRETSCWYQACQKETDPERCMSTFYCDDRKTSTEVNTTFFYEHCKIDLPDGSTGPFQYGIFLDSLKTGNTGHINFPTKLAYSFWWGLRNLSNFGTNLITSSYVWENLFAVLISITGLLLFLYLIGNVQIFIQIKSEEIRQEEIRRLGEIRQKIKLKRQVIKAWMAEKGIPDDIKKEIMKNMHQKLEEDKDADLENIFNVLPWYTKKFLKRVLCLNILSQVQLLKEMDDKVLKMMCNYLMPVTYPEDKIIFQRGHLIDRMLLIIEGTLSTYSTTPDPSLTHGGETDSGSTATKQVEKGEVYGEELLKWALASPNESGRFENLPTCLENVRCHTKVEGFALSAEDLRSVYREMKKKNFIKLKRKYFEDSIHLSSGKKVM